MQCGPSRFEIRMAHGVAIPVDNATSIAILDVLEDSDMILSDISNKTDIPTSTVFFNLKTMIKNGLISSYRDGVNENKVLYSISSVKMMEFGLSDMDATEVIQELISRMAGDPSYFYRGLAMFIALNCFRGGMDVTPTFDHASRFLAQRMNGMFKSDNLEDLLAEVMDFMKDAGMPEISVYTVVPLTLSLHQMVPLEDRFLKAYISSIGFIMQVIEDTLGIRYVLESASAVSSDDAHFVMIAADNVHKEIHANPLDIKEKPFMVLYCDGRPAMIDNKSQMQIIDRLMLGDSTSADISRDTDVSLQTVYSNLGKMSELGIVSSYFDDFGNGPIYKLESYVTLATKEVSRIPEESMNAIMARVSENPSGYYSNLLICLIHMFDSLGIDWSASVKYIGNVLADGAMARLNDVVADRVIDGLCTADLPFGTKVDLESRFPLTLRVSFSTEPDALLERYLGYLYDGFFNSIFNRISKIGCIAQRSVTDPDGRDLIYTVVYVD